MSFIIRNIRFFLNLFFSKKDLNKNTNTSPQDDIIVSFNHTNDYTFYYLCGVFIFFTALSLLRIKRTIDVSQHLPDSPYKIVVDYDPLELISNKEGIVLTSAIMYMISYIHKKFFKKPNNIEPQENILEESLQKDVLNNNINIEPQESFQKDVLNVVDNINTVSQEIPFNLGNANMLICLICLLDYLTNLFKIDILVVLNYAFNHVSKEPMELLENSLNLLLFQIGTFLWFLAMNTCVIWGLTFIYDTLLENYKNYKNK